MKMLTCDSVILLFTLVLVKVLIWQLATRQEMTLDQKFDFTEHVIPGFFISSLRNLLLVSACPTCLLHRQTLLALLTTLKSFMLGMFNPCDSCSILLLQRLTEQFDLLTGAIKLVCPS